MQQTTITELRARRIWDSRGRPTIEAQVQLADGSLGLGQAPAGASTGRHEALELRDGDDDPFLGGLDVQTAIRQCDALIRPMLIGQQADQQSQIDQCLIDIDPHPNKAKLGANTTLAVSLACAKAAAQSKAIALYEHLAAQLPAAQSEQAFKAGWRCC
ncbi:MAG: hypothetical protein EBX72_00610 [Betaproteobacteria bacterium]|nr:hypothetical protein [Betaproteobacteria bacterium]